MYSICRTLTSTKRRKDELGRRNPIGGKEPFPALSHQVAELPQIGLRDRWCLGSLRALPPLSMLDLAMLF